MCNELRILRRQIRIFVNARLATIIELTHKYINRNKKSINKRRKNKEFVQIYKFVKRSRIIENVKVKSTKAQN